MNITIIPADGIMLVDGISHTVPMQAAPKDVHALQWNNTTGHIEQEGAPNKPLTELPAWVTPLLAAWQSAQATATAPPPPPTLEQAKAAKLAAIHAEKNRIRDAGFLVDGVLFDSDLPARTSYAELAIALQQDPSLTLRWKASPGVWVTMDAALFAKVYATGRKHLEACFAWQEAQEQALAEAKTTEDAQAIMTTFNG